MMSLRPTEVVKAIGFSHLFGALLFCCVSFLHAKSLEPDIWDSSVLVVKGAFVLPKIGQTPEEKPGTVQDKGREIKGVWSSLDFKIIKDFKGLKKSSDILKIRFFRPNDPVSASKFNMPYGQCLLLFLKPSSDQNEYVVSQDGQGWLVDSSAVQSVNDSGLDALKEEFLSLLSSKNLDSIRNENIRRLRELGNSEAISAKVAEILETQMIDDAIDAAVSYHVPNEKLEEVLLDLQKNLPSKDSFRILSKRIKNGSLNAILEGENLYSSGKLPEDISVNMPWYLTKGVETLAKAGNVDEVAKLASSPVESVRIAALAGMRESGKIDLKLCLIALDDKSLNVKYQGLKSLYKLYPLATVKMPMKSTFEENPDYWVNEWRRWVTEQAKVLK